MNRNEVHACFNRLAMRILMRGNILGGGRVGSTLDLTLNLTKLRADDYEECLNFPVTQPVQAQMYDCI